MMTPQQVVDWLKYDARTPFFVNAMQFINWERVEGDVLEFGVSVGKSFALLAQLYRENLELWRYTEPPVTSRRFGGFDTFAGLPPDEAAHPRWGTGSFGNNYLHGHPTMAFDERITADKIRALFRAARLPEPELEEGLFSDTMPGVIGAGKKFEKVALLHVDSDLYPSAKQVLVGCEPILQDGTVVCFDDWFMYRGNPDMGEQRALREFLEEYPHWRAIPYQTYSVFCNSFILHRR